MIPTLPRSLGVGPLRSLAGFVAVTAALFFTARALVPAEKVCPDFICFWSAARLISSGQSPYDIALQVEVQHALGWDKSTDGYGMWDCLPYYYPPWFGMLLVPLLPLGFTGAKIAWLVINLELLFLASVLLRDTAASLPRSIPIVLVLAFAFPVLAVMLGQTPPLILCLIAAAWKLLEKRWDASAGIVLAWLSIKPQLTAVLLLAIFLWAVRQRRWRVLLGFATTLGLLAIASTLVLPGWLFEMVKAPGRTPLPTSYYPWVGTTWFLVLKTLGLHSWWLGGLYLAVALPFLGGVVRKALDRESSLKDVMALGIMAAFFVAPYSLSYDFTVLLFPMLVLLGDRLSERAGTLFLFTLIFLPYLHIQNASRIPLWWVPTRFSHQVTLCWIPLLLVIVWLASGLRGRGTRVASRPHGGPLGEEALAAAADSMPIGGY
jgi:hypothetical protein